MAIPKLTGDFERAIMLAISRLGDNAYGTTVIQELENLRGSDVTVGAFYTSVRRLEDKGLISSKLGDPTPERGGRAKRYYKLTATGSHSLDQSLEQLRRISVAAIGVKRYA